MPIDKPLRPNLYPKETMAEFTFQEIFESGPDQTTYKKISSDHVESLEVGGKTFLVVEPEGLTLLAKQALKEVSHLLRPTHLAGLRRILEDPEASENDRFVATNLLENA